MRYLGLGLMLLPTVAMMTAATNGYIWAAMWTIIWFAGLLLVIKFNPFKN